MQAGPDPGASDVHRVQAKRRWTPQDIPVALGTARSVPSASAEPLNLSHFSHQYQETYVNRSYLIRETGVDFPGSVVAEG